MANMNIGEVKQKYGDRLCLMGSVNCATTLSSGTLEEVRQETKEVIRKAEIGGELIAASSHSIHSAVKPENYVEVRADTRNWLEAALYDLENARHMLSSGRYLYVVFLCYLTLEKLLKAVVTELTGQTAPRSHNLIYLVKRSGISLEPRYLDFIGKLNNASIPTRYPSDIREAIREYTQ